MRVYQCLKCGGEEWVSNDVEQMVHFHVGANFVLQEIPVDLTGGTFPDYLKPMMRIFASDRSVSAAIFAIEEVKSKEDLFKIQDVLMKTFERIDKE